MTKTERKISKQLDVHDVTRYFRQPKLANVLFLSAGQRRELGQQFLKWTRRNNPRHTLLDDLVKAVHRYKFYDMWSTNPSNELVETITPLLVRARLLDIHAPLIELLNTRVRRDSHG